VTYLGERVNVDMTARILEVAAATDVQRVVCTSTNRRASGTNAPTSNA
jgi:nucleoside-diphosphate-sugar epimerase